MATLDELIREIDSRFCLGAKAGLLVQQALCLICGQPGGIDGFLNRFKDAGFAVEVASWLDGSDPVPLSGQELEQTLGSDVINEIANKAAISQSFTRTILGYATPKIIVLLTPGGVIPSTIPASAKSFLESAIPLSFSAEEPPVHSAERIWPGGTEQFGATVRTMPLRLEQIFAYGAHAAVAALLFGFAWAAGSYFSKDQSRLVAVKPPFAGAVMLQETAESTEMLRTAQKMAEDIQALKANVVALSTAVSQGGKGVTTVEELSTRLDDVKSETRTSLAELAGKVERMQRERSAILSQLIERLDRIEHQIAGPLASASLAATSISEGAAARRQAQIAVAPAKRLLEARGQINPGGRSDAIGLSRNSAARAVRRLGSLAPNPSGPQLIRNWVVRDVYDGVALVESPRGAIEVAPGEIIPGAGTVESIERRGAGWIVITSRGLVDSAIDSFEP